MGGGKADFKLQNAYFRLKKGLIFLKKKKIPGQNWQNFLGEKFGKFSKIHLQCRNCPNSILSVPGDRGVVCLGGTASKSFKKYE